VSVLDDYLDTLPNVDVSALFNADVEAIEAVNYTNPLVYKYYGARRRPFFERPLLRFSQRESLNDPLEMSQRWKTISTDGLRTCVRADLREKLSEISDNSDLLLKLFQEKSANEGMSLSFSMIAQAQKKLRSAAGRRSVAKQFIETQEVLDRMVDQVFSMIEDQFETLVEGVLSRLGVLSLTEDPLNEQMWAHYADGGRGFIIGLDAHHQFFLNKDATKNSLHKVRYTDERLNNFWNNPYFLFLVKSRGWSDLLPELSSFIRRVCSGYTPPWGVLRTRLV
jgi:hypothetical protein